MNRSVMSNKGKMLVGDSVYYDSKDGFSQAFRNVVYVDALPSVLIVLWLLTTLRVTRSLCMPTPSRL